MIDAADRNFLIPCSCIFYYIINSERMIDMIVEAINKRTGKTVKIEEAYSGQRLTCPYCGVEVHLRKLVSGLGSARDHRGVYDR